MLRNQTIRMTARQLGVLGRRLGLAQAPLLQNLYGRIAWRALPDSDVRAVVDDQTMLVPNPRRDALGRMLYLHGVWEASVTRFLCATVRPGMTVLDIGAYIGYFTLLLARRVGDQGRVIAFEPNPAARKILQENVRLNGYRHVTLCPFALSREKSLGVLDGREGLKLRLSKPFPGVDGQTIRVEALDDCRAELEIGTVDLVKVDVEGAELEALYGMRGLLAECHPALLIEVHPAGLREFGHSQSELLDFVGRFGYDVKPVWSQETNSTLDTTTVFCHSAREAA